MDKRLKEVLDRIGERYAADLEKGSRHYLEVSVGEQAHLLGYDDLFEMYRHTYAVVPLKAPKAGMKVRIDGRTFVNYAQYASGIAVPGYLARKVGESHGSFVPNHSMICNYT